MGSKKPIVSFKLISAITLLVTSLANNLYASPVSSVSSLAPRSDILSRFIREAKPPSVPTAPLDPNDNIHHTLDEVNSILGTLGGASSGAVMGLTGISITDCALTIKEEDLNTITCSQFIDKLSECDSMAHVKPLLQQAKNKYRKGSNARSPCFRRKGKGRKHSG